MGADTTHNSGSTQQSLVDVSFYRPLSRPISTDDPLGPARGILLAVVLGAALWAPIIAALFHFHVLGK